MARKPTDTVKLQLRFHEALRRRLAQEAKKHDRSLNAEIVHRLEQSLDVPEQAAALASEVRSAAKSAFRELFPPGSVSAESVKSVLREWLSSEFAERRIGSVSTAEDDGEKK
jgi:Arc-like DNA binding domain